MTETVKPTPGPWLLCAHLKDGDQCSCGYRGVIWGPDSKAICQPGHEPAPEGQEGTEPERYPREVELANARLIAAAPDLLNAAKAVIAQWETPNWKLTEPTAKFMSDLRDAISKAEPSQ